MKIKFSIRNILILGSICMYLGMYSLVSQNPQQQLNLSASPPPAPTNVIAAITAGRQGNSQAYYWVVANYASGKSAFSTPSFIANAQTNANILVTWDSMAGATSYDILRTTTTVIPNTSCTCAVATAQVGTSYADTLNSALNNYNFSSVGPSSSVMFIDNIHYKSAVTKLTGSEVIGTPADTTLVMPDGSLNIRGNFYQNGVLFTGGGGGITQLTGDGTAGPGSGSQALTLATVNAGPGDCGADATHVCDITTDAQGRVRSQTLIALSGGGASEFGQLTNASLARTSNTILTLTLPSLGTNLGPTAKAFAASSQTITISTGCGVATTFFVYYSPNDQAIDIDTTAANFTGIAVTAGWATKSTGVTGFPNNGFGIVPVATLNCGVVANQWNAGAGAFTDNRTELSTSVVNVGGVFLSETVDSKAQKSISVNTTHLTKAAGIFLVSASAALASTAGTILCTDGAGGAKDIGCIGGNFAAPIITNYPVSGNFTALNGASTTGGSSTPMLLTVPGSAIDSVKAMEIAIPARPYTIITCMDVLFAEADFAWGGLEVRDSGSGKIAAFGFTQQAAQLISYDKYNSVSSYNGQTTLRNVTNYKALGKYPRCFKFVDDNVNFTFSVSFDKINWQDFTPISRIDWLANPTHIGWYANSRNSTPVFVTLWDWEQQ